MRRHILMAALAMCGLGVGGATAQSELPLTVTWTTASIVVDGRLNEPEWRNATAPNLTRSIARFCIGLENKGYLESKAVGRGRKRRIMYRATIQGQRAIEQARGKLAWLGDSLGQPADDNRKVPAERLLRVGRLPNARLLS